MDGKRGATDTTPRALDSRKTAARHGPAKPSSPSGLAACTAAAVSRRPSAVGKPVPPWGDAGQQQGTAQRRVARRGSGKEKKEGHETNGPYQLNNRAAAPTEDYIRPARSLPPPGRKATCQSSTTEGEGRHVVCVAATGLRDAARRVPSDSSWTDGQLRPADRGATCARRRAHAQSTK